MRIAIIGGGIIGLGTAWRLAQQSVEVVVYESERLASGSSRAAAGMIAPLAEAAAEAASNPTAKEAFLSAGLRSRDLWIAWAEEIRSEVGALEHDRSGTLFLAFDHRQLRALDRLEQLAAEIGEPAGTLSAADVRAALPDLGDTRDGRLLSALHLEGEHRVHNIQACGALSALARRVGVAFREQSPVERIDPSTDHVDVTSRGRVERFDQAVIAGGAWSGSIEGLPKLPVRPMRGQMLQLDRVHWPWQGSLRVPGPFYAVRREGHRLVVGATVEDVGFNPTTTKEGLLGLKRFVASTFPGIDLERPTAAWAGLRPSSPDRLPLIGRLEDAPIVYATGHYRNGILLAPWTAETLTDWLLHPASEPDAHAFSPNRFVGRESAPDLADSPLSSGAEGWSPDADPGSTVH